MSEVSARSFPVFWDPAIGRDRPYGWPDHPWGPQTGVFVRETCFRCRNSDVFIQSTGFSSNFHPNPGIFNPKTMFSIRNPWIFSPETIFGSESRDLRDTIPGFSFIKRDFGLKSREFHPSHGIFIKIPCVFGPKTGFRPRNPGILLIFLKNGLRSIEIHRNP